MSKQAASAIEAVSSIQSGDHVFIHTAGGTPQALVNAMTARASELRNVKIYHMHTEGAAPYAEDQYEDNFHVNSLFLGANMRKAVNSGRTDFIPSFFSEVPLMFRNGVIPIDVALIQVSPPDKHGYCSLGISVDTTKAAVDSAKIVIAQINPRMPRTHGDGLLHISMFHSYIEESQETT